jgi:phosphatidate cytidylyltransferase
MAELDEKARPDYGRAGRNVPVSLIAGVILLLAVFLPLFFVKQIFVIVLVLAATLGVWEMVRAIRTGEAKPEMYPLVGGAAAIMILTWYADLRGLTIGLLVAVLTAMVWRMGDGPAGYQRDIGSSVFILVYVPFLLGFAALLARADDGQWRIVATLAAIVLSDTGGYVAGVLLGKHPMAPSISPKKSWEGFGGSVLAASLGSAFIVGQLFDVNFFKGALFGFVVSIAAVLGDLAESLLKRDLGIKDMSNMIPGHGGLMDRLDSIVFAAPTAYLLLSVLAPVP